MPYPQRRKTYFYLGFLLILIIVFHYVGLLGPAERLIRYISTPLTAKIYKTSVNLNAEYDLTVNRQEFLGKYDSYRRDAEAKTAIEAKMQTVVEENEALKQQLGFKQSTQLQVVTAEVVGRDLDNINKTLLINQGSNSGIQIDQAVITDSGIMIGKIIKVEPTVSVVGLVSDSQTRISALILNADRSLGAVEGGRGLSLTMNLIPRNEVVTVGDEVVTSGFETNIPRGMLIGTVAVVENEAYKPFQQAVLVPATDLSKVILVGVLTNN